LSAPHVELVCDGAPDVGYGHVRRALTLADALRAEGVTTRLSALSPEAQASLPAQPEYKGEARVVVLDVPHGGDALILRARESGQRVVALDWFGAEEPDVAIVVHPHRPVRARFRCFIGWQYLMIRAEIASKPRGLIGEGVLVVLGGGDVLKQGHAAAQRLADQGIAATLVQGPLAADLGASEHYEVLVDPPDLAQRLAACGWMVTNGGGCMFEAMCLGKATVALPQTEAEKVLTCVAMERGGLLGIGFEYLRPYTHRELQCVARRAADLVDGGGAERVAGIVKDQI